MIHFVTRIQVLHLARKRTVLRYIVEGVSSPQDTHRLLVCGAAAIGRRQSAHTHDDVVSRQCIAGALCSSAIALLRSVCARSSFSACGSQSRLPLKHQEDR